MERSAGTLPVDTSVPPSRVCGLCRTPLPPPRPRATTPRRWCSPRCASRAFIERKVAAQVDVRLAAPPAREAEVLAVLDGIERLCRMLKTRLEFP